MTFKDALHTLSTNLIMKIALPDWAKNFTKHTRKVHLAFMELKVCKRQQVVHYACLTHASYLAQQYMLEMVEARRNVDKDEQRHDLFSGLLKAADDGEALNDEELLGVSLTSRSFGIL
jgi:cytochrome P450